jgi:hypothetical protein
MVNFVFVFEGDEIRIYVYDVFAVERNAISGLVFLADSLWKKPIPMSYFVVANFMERIGVLLKNRLLDITLVSQLMTVTDFWEKMKPLIEGIRKEEHNQNYYAYFEYLYNEMKKREQKLQSKA